MNKSMNRPLPEANCKKGNLLWGGRLGETCEAMNKKRIKGRKGDDELAPHSEVAGSCPYGKSDVCAGKQRVLTWGGPVGGNVGGKSAEVIVVRKQAGGVESSV